MEQLEGMIGTLRVYTSRLATKESYWIFQDVYKRQSPSCMQDDIPDKANINSQENKAIMNFMAEIAAVERYVFPFSELNTFIEDVYKRQMSCPIPEPGQVSVR